MINYEIDKQKVKNIVKECDFAKKVITFREFVPK